MELTIVAFACILAANFVGAMMQRISGMGLALRGAPVVALVAGPVAGVLVINVVATVNAAMQSASAWEYIDSREFWLIGPVMARGALPGTWVVHNPPLGPLQMIVGALVLLALLVTSRLPERAQLDGPQYAVAAGVAGGFMNTLAGIAGPAITVYAQVSRWPTRTFAATRQPLFFVSGTLSLLFKELTAEQSIFATAPVLLWPLCLLALVVGIATGSKLSRYISLERAHKLSLSMATLGAGVVMIRGAMQTFGG